MVHPLKEIEETKENEKKRRRKGSKKSGNESDEDIDIDSDPYLGQIDKIVMQAFSSPATISTLRSGLLPDIISALQTQYRGLITH